MPGAGAGYDELMPKPLSYEALFAALAVLGTSACSKEAAPAAKAEPASQAAAVPVAAPVAPGAPADKAPEPSAAPVVPPPVASAVAPGTETRKPAAAPRKNIDRKVNAACGAGTCSDEMKK